MYSNYLAALEFSLLVTLPIFLIVLLGLLLRRTGQIDDAFVGVASKLVFNICLPVLMFFAIVESDVSLVRHWRLASYAAVAAGLSFLLFWWLSRSLVSAAQDRGVAVQSAFRSNLGIVGIALCANAFGQAGLAVAALILATVTPLYNIFSIYALTRSLDEARSIHWPQILLSIVKNPLILSILLALLCVALGWRLPQVLNESGRYLSRMTLPLALLTIGGSLSMTALKAASRLSAWVVLAKLVLLPVAVTLGAGWLGFRGVELGCLMLMFASPTAAAAFVMARAIGGNYKLASNTIALSTVLSPLTISVFLYGLALAGAISMDSLTP